MPLSNVMKINPFANYYRQVILAVLLSWIVCAILTAAGAFTGDSTGYGYSARTDTRMEVLRNADWFRIPYPGLLVD